MPPRGPRRGSHGRGATRGSKASTPVGSNQGTPIPNRPVTPEKSRNPSPAHIPPPYTPTGSDDDIRTGYIPSSYPVLLSPIKQKKRAIAVSVRDMTDVEVWDKPDDEIIEASFSKFKSPVYNHYYVSLDCRTANGGHKIFFIFTCKTCPGAGPTLHNVQHRGRMDTDHGTKNLKTSMESCEGYQREEARSSALSLVSTIPYSPINHRTLLVLQCADSMWPFNMVNDKFYQMQVQMLHPGTKLPSHDTIQRDTIYLFKVMSLHVQQYFQLLNSTFHVALDGWTAPTTASFLGLVIVWVEDGELHRAILDFI
ncbi:hypothetical protein BDQ17DRAFT_1548146 [Cyathus striatus]|nr:hypothetical protein BDQ17DRAFT_1548146 [Cyathus striatus]